MRLFLFLFISFLSLNLAAQKSEVYFTRDISPEGVMKLYEKIKGNIKGKVAIKVHFGEEGNQNYIRPDIMKLLVDTTKATFVETNVLYVSKRRYTDSHIQLAKDHGFTFAPIDILDSEGEISLPCSTTHFTEVKVGSHINNYDTYIIFSHFKGHGLSGFGGAIKNVSMGMASISGKLAMHASTIPTVDDKKCTRCGRCLTQCPGGAITLNPLTIDTTKCIGCGKCIGECPFQAFGVPWTSTSPSVFLERLVEYAAVIATGRNFVYINVLANISSACDCAKRAPLPFMDDIGILASVDIVAIENASHDLVNKAHKCDDAFLQESKTSGKNQIEYAHKLGLGNKNYILIDLDKK